MLIKYTDFNNADKEIANYYSQEWAEIRYVLTALPLYLKASEQAGISGNAIFDVVGMNKAIRDALTQYQWQSIPIPAQYSAFGIDIDFGKPGISVEVQFSTYPYLLNNLIRLELLHRTQTALLGRPPSLLVIITKAHMFPASQGTLYYEQAVDQLTALVSNQIFLVPTRVVGLYEQENTVVAAKWTNYTARTSRTVVAREDVFCEVIAGQSSSHRCKLRVIRNPPGH